MKYVEPSVVLLPTPEDPSQMEIMRHIEAAGRTCYKSEDRITAMSAKQFYDMLVVRGHLSPLEHVEMDMIGPEIATVTALQTFFSLYHGYHNLFMYGCGDGSKFDTRVVYGNLRMWIDLLTTGMDSYFGLPGICQTVVDTWPDLFGWVDQAALADAIKRGQRNFYTKFVTSVKPFFPDYSDMHKRYTMRIVCDRGISHELVRHRMFSFSQESTRYVRYDEGLQVIMPRFENDAQQTAWAQGVGAAETAYQTLRRSGLAPEIARSVLPTCTKTELVMTGMLGDWMHMLMQRTSMAAHPQMQEIAWQIAECLEPYATEVNFESFLHAR